MYCCLPAHPQGSPPVVSPAEIVPPVNSVGTILLLTEAVPAVDVVAECSDARRGDRAATGLGKVSLKNNLRRGVHLQRMIR